MPEIGPLEVLTFGVIALIVVGPERLPAMSRKAARSLAELRDGVRRLSREFEPHDDDDDHDITDTKIEGGAA